MRIIVRGIDPKTLEYKQTCPECKTTFAFFKKEVTVEQRDGSFIICPLCGKFLTPSYDNTVPPSSASSYYEK